MFNWDVKHFVLSHLVWIAALSVALVLGHSWIQEHDARLLADAQVKQSSQIVKSLQDQIISVQNAAKQQTQVITRIVHDVKTPEQAIAAIPQLTDVPLNARPIPQAPGSVSVDVMPLVQALGECKVAQVNLQACQTELSAQEKIEEQKDIQIAALKKKPAFWKKVGTTLKTVGIGVAIGALLVHGL